MVSISEVLKWQPGTLSEVTDGLLRKKRSLTDLQDEMEGALPPYTWVSPHATTAREKHERLRLRLLDMVAEVGRVSASVDFAEAEVKAAKDSLTAALDAAASAGLRVDRDTGEVTDPRTYANEVDALRASGRVADAADRIRDALTAAQTADSDLCAALQAAIDGTVDGGTGSFGSAGNQLPSALVGMEPAEIAKRYADDVALQTLQAWLEANGEAFGFKIEGAAKATSIVRGDGTVTMALHLEGGLGRSVSVGTASADVTGGLTTDLELSFDSPEEAQAFLDGLDDAAMALSWKELGYAPAAIADNVADYIGEQDVSSFKTGFYGKASGEFDVGWASGDASGRVDGTYDWVKEKYGLKVSAQASGDVGGEDSGIKGAAALSGELKLDKGGELEEAVFSGSISGKMANDKFGVDIPHTSTGAGADIEVKMAEDNPHFAEFKATAMRGDLDGAADLALEHGRVVVRTFSIEEFADERKKLEAGPVGDGEIRFGASAETAQQVWVRPPGEHYVLAVDPQKVLR